MTDSSHEQTLAAALVTVRRYSGRSQMVGFEAFGCTDDGVADPGDPDPIVRELGTVTFGPTGGIVMRQEPDASVWPRAEITGGVAAVEIHTYGDKPAGAYIRVCGTDRVAVERMWHRARAAFDACRGDLWNLTASEAGS